MPLPQALKTFLWLSAGLFAACALYVLVEWRTNHAPHHGLPLDIYTRLPLYDLVGLVIKMPLVHDAAFFGGAWPYTYPAPGVLVFGFFALFARWPASHPFLGSLAAYLALASGALLLLCHRFAVALRARGLHPRQAALFAYGTLLLSWPILYGLHQGNIEVLLWLGVAAALWFYRQERWWSFALLIGSVGAVKIYPLVFLLLLLPARRWKELAGAVGVLIALTWGSLAYIGPSIAVAARRVAGGVALNNRMGMSAAGVPLSSKPFDHSLLGLLHRLMSASPAAVNVLNHVYIPAVAVAFAGLYFGHVRKLPLANQVLFLTLAAVTLPSVSFDYTLQLLYIPFAWIVMEGIARAASREACRWLQPLMICFALVLSPEVFLAAGGVQFYGQFKAVMLIVMFAICLRLPIEGTAHKEAGWQSVPVQ